jgi:hypothetical protein
VDKRLCKGRNFTETITNPACGPPPPPSATLTPSPKEPPHPFVREKCPSVSTGRPISHSPPLISNGIVTVEHTKNGYVTSVGCLYFGERHVLEAGAKQRICLVCVSHENVLK